MRKLVAVILSVLIVMGCVPFAYAESGDLSLIVATDIHYHKKDSTTQITKSTEENPFGHTVSNGKLTAESAAIFDEFLKEAAESDCDYVLITGDISDNGEIENVQAAVEKLEAFERSSGKTVIACMGNHEAYHGDQGFYVVKGLTGPEFREYYKNLGYDIALDVDESSASYTVDLNSKYRLICIDSNVMNDRLVEWIGQQAEKAAKDGKNLISASHLSLFPHYEMESLASGSVIDESYGLPDKFIEWGIKFNFSGHTHELDTAEYTNDKGIVYDITSGSLTTYPCNYKTAVFTDSRVTLDTKYIEKIDTSLVPEGLAPEAAELLENDFRAYAKKMFVMGAQSEISVYIDADYIISLARLNPSKDREIIDLIRLLIPKVNEAINMPLYGENSLSSIAEKNGYNIPESEYSTFLGVIGEIYCCHCAGNEHCSSYTGLGKIAFNGLAAALSYSLDELSREDFQTVINWALNTFELPFDVPPMLGSITTGVLVNQKDIEYVLINIASPFIDDFFNDTYPDDVSAAFPGYGMNEAKTATFIVKLKQFLNTILLLLDSIFSLIFR